MVNPAVEAAAAEALVELRPWLIRRPRWWQVRYREDRLMAIGHYLMKVCQAHLFAMCESTFLPDEEESEYRLAEAIQHAVEVADDSDVAAAAGELDKTLADIWRYGYKAELARRWHAQRDFPIHSRCTPEMDAYDAEARAEWARMQRERQDARQAEQEAQAEQQPQADEGTADVDEGLVQWRLNLLEDYKAATGASEYAIYAYGEHGCHKPEFYAWKKGKLPASSSMAQSLERFLREKKPPRGRNKRPE